VFLKIDGCHLSTLTLGQSEATFVAHGGWTGSSELWVEPFQLMQDRWRCIAYDHRGSGASDFPPDSITSDVLVEDLFTVLDHFGVARCLLAGESLGAMTCIAAVLREPARFEGLVLIDPATAVDPEGTRSLVDGARRDYTATIAAFVDACMPEPGTEHLRRWGRQILSRADPEAAARLFEVHHLVVHDLGTISVPTLVLHGENDAIIPLPAAQAAAAAIPECELIIIPDAGHVPTLTRPREVAAAIDAWTARIAQPT
jgi:pimeloyl-ACP methyl ester carboxylesterase